MNWRRLLATVLVFLLICGLPLAAQEAATEVRTRDGRVFFADSVEVRGDIMVLRPRGLGIIEVRSADVLCIGAQCAKVALKPAPADDNRVAIQGSNTIGATLMPMLVRKFAETLPSSDVQVEFGNKAEEQTLRIRSNGAEKFVAELASHGSGTSFKGLLAGTADIGMSSRAIKPDEVATLNQKYSQNMLAADSEHVLGLDGLAVVVSRSNPLRDRVFDIETLARIFSGEVKSWSEIGGPAAPIAVHARDEKSGTYDTFNDLVLKPHKKVISPAASRYESSEQIAEAVEKDAGAIGFIGLAYVRNNQPLAIGSSCGLGATPTRFAVQTEVYPLARRLYLYTLGAPRGTWARDLVAFSLSDAAQPIVRDAGFVDQSIEAEPADAKKQWLAALAANPSPLVPPRLAGQFTRLAQAVQRTSVVFRFAPNATEFDSKSKKDALRLARFLRQPAQAGRSLYVIGFSDESGQLTSNLALSRERAKAVAAVLAKEGVTVGEANTIALGPAGPVACNSDERGRALNRRVEVWVGDKPVAAPAAPAASPPVATKAQPKPPLKASAASQ